MRPSTARPVSYAGVAFNQVPESENRIHSDETAKRFGFRGGLVPGVTVSAYLCHPAVCAWGEDWLARGSAHVAVKSPLYDGERFGVEVGAASGSSYEAVLRSGSAEPLATAQVELPSSAPVAPQMRGDRRATRDHERPLASRALMERLQESGMRALRTRFSADAPMARYFRDRGAMPPACREDGEALANPAFVLGVTNWALAANVRMPAWLHLETWSQSFEAIPVNSELVVESEITDLFDKQGHEFVDLDVVTFLEVERRAVTRTRLRAIYRLRDA